MKTMYFRFAAWTVALGFGLILVTGASAQCGLPKKPVKPAAWHPSGKDRLLYVRANDDEEHGASIVGMWHTVFTGQTLNGAPFSGVVDNAVLVFHSDGTEILNSSRAPETQSFCLGVWKKITPFHYRLNHFAISWANGSLLGPGNIRENVILSHDGNSFTGTFTVDQYDQAGHILVHLVGQIEGKRITVDTPVTDVL